MQVLSVFLSFFPKYRLELDLLIQAGIEAAKKPQYISHNDSTMQPPQTAAGKSKTISQQMNLHLPWPATPLTDAAHVVTMGFV